MELIEKQRTYFKSHITLNINEKKKNLLYLRKLLYKYYDDFVLALEKDFNKHEFDTLSNEFLMVINECNYLIKHLNRLARTKRVKTNIINFSSSGYLKYEPYGVCLIMAPWNYPLQLLLEPALGAIAAGNTVILKPSEYAPNTASVIKKLVDEFNNESLLAIVLGDYKISQELLNNRFDYIFFTGGEKVGKIVLEKASRYLTPVTLELGGKSPCIVTSSANLKQACKRIVWGKYLNAGQTCVAPDYILIDKNIKDQFIQECITYIKETLYTDNHLNNDYPCIINKFHLERLLSLIDNEKVVFGGKVNKLQLEPTILDNITFADKCMQEEIFGPILPIITYDSFQDVIPLLIDKEKPLALYIFSNDKKEINSIVSTLSFGGGCINDVIMHLTNENLPFGGVGNSGMGSYHGKQSFITFSHQKSIFKKGKIELPFKYNKSLKIVKKITKIK